jgi:hypothetical protein
MTKRTRIAVVITTLLVAVVAPAVNPPTRQVAEAGTLNWEEVFATLDRVIPRTGWTRTGRPAFLTVEQRWRLAKVACEVNEVHDNVYEYEPEVSALLSELDLPNPYRFQSPVLTLTRQIYEFKDAAGPAYEVGSQMFCDHADWSLEQGASGATG